MGHPGSGVPFRIFVRERLVSRRVSMAVPGRQDQFGDGRCIYSRRIAALISLCLSSFKCAGLDVSHISFVMEDSGAGINLGPVFWPIYWGMVLYSLCPLLTTDLVVVGFVISIGYDDHHLCLVIETSDSPCPASQGSRFSKPILTSHIRRTGLAYRLS